MLDHVHLGCANVYTTAFDLMKATKLGHYDGGFTDCDQLDLPVDECPFLDLYDHRCDFHSFRAPASEDKRLRADTTGAFGIGSAASGAGAFSG